METRTKVTDWKTQTDVKPRGSEFSHEVYFAIYHAAMAVSSTMRVVAPRAELYASQVEYALRRYAAQYELSSKFEVDDSLDTVIQHVVTERMREKSLPFQPPF